MPWAKRTAAYCHFYGISVDDRTMRNWCSKLIDHGIIAKSAGSESTTIWRTHYDGDKPVREPVAENNKADMLRYFQRRHDLLEFHQKENRESGMNAADAIAAAWKQTYSDLWTEFNCCYYSCKSFTLNAFSNSGIDVIEVYELCRELAAAAPPPPKPSPPPPQPKAGFVF